MNDRTIYPVLCSGHSGSRLLVRLMMANGIFMGASRSAVGEDESVFGEMLWTEALQRTYTVLKKYPDDHRNYKTLHTILNRAHNKFIKGLNASQVLPKAVGFKDATLFPYVAAEYRSLMQTHGIRTRYIHLVRHPLHWVLSGRDPNSSGIQRPSRHANFSRLSDPFIRLVWFDSLRDTVTWRDKTIELSDYQVYSEDEQILLEAMMWRTTNTISADLDHGDGDYLQIAYEDLILHPKQTLAALGTFMGIPVEQPASVPIHQNRLAKDPRASLSRQSVEAVYEVCGELMDRLALPHEPPRVEEPAQRASVS